jgi:hypothetical protein
MSVLLCIALAVVFLRLMTLLEICELFFRFTAITRDLNIIMTFRLLYYQGLQKLSTMYVAVWRTIFYT